MRQKCADYKVFDMTDKKTYYIRTINLKRLNEKTESVYFKRINIKIKSCLVKWHLPDFPIASRKAQNIEKK